VQQQQRTDDDDDDDDSSDEEVPAAPMHGPTPVQRLVVGTQLCLLQPEHVDIKAFQTPRFAPLRALVHGLVTTPDAVGWSQQRVVQLPSAGIGKPQLSIWAKKLDDATLRFRFDDSRSSTGFGIDALIRKLGTVSAASEGLTRVHVSEFLQGGFFYTTRCSDGFQVKLLLDREHEDRTWKRKTLLARPKRPPSHKPPSPAPVPPPPAAAPPPPPVPPPPHPPTQPATPQSTPEAATVSQTTPMALDARLEALLAQFDERVDANEVVAADYAKHVESFFTTNARPPTEVESQALLDNARAERVRTTKLGDVTREEVLKLLIDLRALPAQVAALEVRVSQH